MNQLSHGQKINIPSSTIRSVSFQKVRQGSLSSRTPITQQNQKPQKMLQTSGLCQRLISKKLTSNQNQPQRKPIDQKDIKNNINQKTALLKKHLQEKQMKECTFKPKVNKSTAPQRTLGQFIGHQKAYQKQKEDKVTQMRQIIRAKIDKENTFQPNIVGGNKNQQPKKNSLLVHERLYEQFTKRKQSKQNTVPQSLQKRNDSKFTTQRKINTFSRKGSQKSMLESCLASKKHILTNNDLSDFNSSIPNASQSSKQNTQMNQHEDCIITARRQNSRTNSVRSSKSQKGLKVTKYMDVQEVCDKKLYLKNKLIEQKERQTKKMSHKNKQLYVQKVLRQISSVLSSLNINKSELNYMQMSLILQKMNFFDEQTNMNDRKYLFQIWQMLQGDIYQSCPLTNLIKIIFCLLGCHDFNIVEECLSQFMCQTSSAKRLVLTQKQSKNIKANFQELYLNRLRKGQFVNEPKPQSFSFKPFISKNSSQMAEKYRQRVIQQSEQLLNKNLIEFDINENGQVDHIDLLLLDDKRKQLKMKIKRQQQERQKKRLEDEAMQGQRTKKLRSKGQQKYYESQQAINSRFQHLYELGKQHLRAKNQRPQNVQQIPKECTFQPNVNKSKQNSNKALSKQYSQYNTNNLQASNRVGEDIRDFDKSIFRMYQGRRIREESSCGSKSVTDRSMISEQQQKSRDDDSPFLYLNVNMEGKDDIKVPVFHGDNMKTITHKVKLLMGLEQAQDSKLEQILKLQILPTLREIGMNIDLQ